ncbi:hypothetical protein FKW77_002047 [Venturia effusa]|uniref:BTB domain-containing protein n=1 Tax=Venturia effusa TaxID=50376 RepID=A0A517LI71_9PEZI|nr:hypothetical protein FKW77_002047 [Venturia effusa]
MDSIPSCSPPERGHRPFTPLTDNTIVDLIIETENRESMFTLPRQYLVAVSPYFEKALSGKWVEARDKQIRLEEVGLSTMHMFVEWLFTRQLLMVLHGDEGPSAIDLARRAEDSGMTQSVEWLAIARKLQKGMLSLYVFGDKFDIPQLRRDAIDEMSEFLFTTGTPPQPKVVSLAYGHLPTNSPMIKLFIDAYAQVGDESHVQAARAQDIPMEFFIDVLLQMKSAFVSSYNPCDYHGHVVTKHTKSTKFLEG